MREGQLNKGIGGENLPDEIRIGTVSSIDAVNGMISVIYQDRGGKVTQPLPFLTFNNEYYMPKVGQKVLVAHLSNGSEMGVVLGTFWNAGNIPKESEGYYKELEGGAFLTCKNGELTISAKHITFQSDDGTITVKEIKDKL